jgi:hypothetical protein
MSETYTGSCHCGAVELSVRLKDGVKNAIRCDCSMCRRKGAIMLAAPLDGVRVTKGADKLTVYQFNTMTAKHWFCSVCGIYTHHQRRIDPNEIGVNAGILEGVDIREIDWKWTDGVNHPLDRS